MSGIGWKTGYRIYAALVVLLLVVATVRGWVWMGPFGPGAESRSSGPGAPRMFHK